MAPLPVRVGPPWLRWHRGPFDTIERTYAEIQSWMAEQGLEPKAGMWECYLSDPEVERDPATWRTRIVVPIA